jgi:ribosomal protein S12 methylthiotransferase
MERIALVTLGCAKNLVDSEVMLGFLAKEKYTFVTDLKDANIIIINTCGFIHPARKESIEVIKKAIEVKKKKNSTKIFVAGCYVQRSKQSLLPLFPEVDAWLGVNDFDKIVQAVQNKPYDQSAGCFLYDHNSPRLLSTPPGWAYVKISEGCSHRCSFCAIPLIKGAYKSRSIDSIVTEVKELVSAGVKEINFISQDTTYYGRDLHISNGLPLLLEELLPIKELAWIRLLYSYPEEINDSLLEIMKEEKICSYLDIPFQHSHPRILKKMKRGLDGKAALKLLEKIRKKIPDVAIRTSMVVGFPGEGQEEFQNLKNFIQEARFEHLGVFTYSQEEGTGCYNLGDPIKESVKKKRKDKIMDIQADISFQNHQKYLNKKIDVLIEGTLKQDSNVVVGRGKFQAPEVDGVIFLASQDPNPKIFNTIEKVEITEGDVYDLYGNFIR